MNLQAIDLYHSESGYTTSTHLTLCDIHYSAWVNESEEQWSDCPRDTPGHSNEEPCEACEQENSPYVDTDEWLENLRRYCEKHGEHAPPIFNGS